MNCIDAVEGVVKDIITNIHETFLADNMDDTEYIRNVRTVIEGADRYIQENREIVSSPELLKKVLREFAREIWLASDNRPAQDAPDAPKAAGKTPFDADYYIYYFDHIYNHDAYPP